jgi:K(+)-stimulated pyrophosphate-energized sodium pump
MVQIYLVIVATVLAAMVLELRYQRHVGSIDDAFGGRTYYYQWQLPVSNLISIIGTMLVKITDENAKEAQVQKKR